jgi:hypothetical protein
MSGKHEDSEPAYLSQQQELLTPPSANGEAQREGGAEGEEDILGIADFASDAPPQQHKPEVTKEPFSAAVPPHTGIKRAEPAEPRQVPMQRPEKKQAQARQVFPELDTADAAAEADAPAKQPEEQAEAEDSVFDLDDVTLYSQHQLQPLPPTKLLPQNAAQPWYSIAPPAQAPNSSAASISKPEHRKIAPPVPAKNESESVDDLLDEFMGWND